MGLPNLNKSLRRLPPSHEIGNFESLVMAGSNDYLILKFRSDSNVHYLIFGIHCGELLLNIDSESLSIINLKKKPEKVQNMIRRSIEKRESLKKPKGPRPRNRNINMDAVEGAQILNES